MDYAFDFDSLKAEKANAVRRYNFFRTITKLFRFTELFMALLLLSWLFTRIPFAVDVSGHYVRRISGMVGSPLFVFLVCNVIIATLVAKSGLFSGNTSSVDNAETELYQQIFKNSGDSTKTQSEPGSAVTEEVVFQDKEVVSELNATPCAVMYQCDDVETCSASDVDKSKVYRRSQSEKVMTKQPDHKAEAGRELWRSEMEKHYEKASSSDGLAENMYPHDKLSSGEFKRTVDEFIAERMRCLRQESLAIVVQNRS